MTSADRCRLAARTKPALQVVMTLRLYGDGFRSNLVAHKTTGQKYSVTASLTVHKLVEKEAKEIFTIHRRNF